ncbi:hypothetical protein IFM89_009495 [Coptis chinensis]|uniref:Mediator of RNA polymerase II transcription subunit 33A n=1 Tax=Coptis chinensis TaxID=261450 RepID=A0A835H514_9MAGN|nr:hypothetical protein IFM89_009495 [Coptis chinensis]
MSTESTRFENRVLETVKRCQERKDSPLIWGMEVCKCLREAELKTPSVELGEVLVSNLCFKNNNPYLWKFIEQAISSGILSAFHVLALLSSRVIPHRRTQPEAYRLYLELVVRYTFSSTQMDNVCKKKIAKSVDDTLQLSQTYEIPIVEFGHALALYFFSMIIGLIDCTLKDWGLQHSSTDKLSGVFGDGGCQIMDVESKLDHQDMRTDLHDRLHRMNSTRTVEVLGELTENRKAVVLLHLMLLNMPEKFNGLLQRLQFLEANRLASLNIKSAIARLFANIQRIRGLENHLNKRHLISILTDIGSCSSASCNSFGTTQAASWVPFDIYMETAMDGKQLPATSAIDILKELTKTLQVINRASWQETFQALWISALRLVQRERDPLEGPIPHLDARLCVLLSITPLAIARVIENEELSSFSLRESSGTGSIGSHDDHGMDERSRGTRKHGLISSLQALGQFMGLLCPPASVIIAANNAAAKAAVFISSFKNGNDGFSGRGRSVPHAKSVTSSSESSSDLGSPWSALMEGAHLAGSLKSSLIATPASSFAEIEKLYNIALNGSDEERSTAAKILCGASLSRGWNIQEHVVHFVIKLLSPPVPKNFSGPGSHLVGYISMLNAILFGMSSIDIVHIFSLHGVVPEVAASLMPLCEVFGSLVPTSGHKSSVGDEPSVSTVFSCAFLFLLRLWKFYRPPHEHTIKEGGTYTGSELSLEYLLVLRNSRIALSNSAATNKSDKVMNPHDQSLTQAIYIDSFPKFLSLVLSK